MAIDFPNNPVDGDQHFENGVSWTYFSPPDTWAITSTFNAPGGMAEFVVDLIYPVGRLLISLDNVNPGDQYANTTWELDSIDRAIVGAGGTRVGGDEFGADNHVLTEAQMPAHVHWVDPPSTTTNTTGNHKHNTIHVGSLHTWGNGGGSSSGYISGTTLNNTQTWEYTSTQGNHSHTLNIAGFNSNSRGSSASHSSVQASKAFYTWRRTA